MQKPLASANFLSLRGEASGDVPRNVPRSDAVQAGFILRPFCTMIDWLSINATGPWHTVDAAPGEVFAWDVPNVRPGLAIHAAGDISHPSMSRVFYIQDGMGEKVATICAVPRDHRKAPPEHCTVQFANCTLASGEWRELLRAFLDTGGTYYGVQRIDLSADGWCGIDAPTGDMEVVAIVQAAMGGFGRYFGKAKWRTFHTGAKFNGFQFGSPAQKMCRAYYKKQEMASVGHKAHIAAAWRAAMEAQRRREDPNWSGDADPMKDPREIGRIELLMKGRELRRYYPGESSADELVKLHDEPERRASLLHAGLSTLYDFRMYPRDGRARSAVPMFTWDWSRCVTNTPPEYRREQRARKISAHRVKAALHILHDLHLATNGTLPRALIDEIARAAGPDFVDYLHGAEQRWERQYAALTDGTAKREGATDAFTLSFLRRLREGIQEQDRVEKFHADRGEVQDAEIDDGEPDPF